MKLIIVVLAGVLGLLTTSIVPVWGSTGGVTNVGAFSSSAGHFTGIREWIELEDHGGILKGSLSHELLKFITVHAPGVKSGHIIFRELKTVDGRRSFLLTAPDALMDAIKRVTLFLGPQLGSLELYEQVDNLWLKRLPQSLRVADHHRPDSPPQDLLAFSLQKPGFFWVMESSSSSLDHALFVPQGSSATSLMGGSILWGISAWAAAILLLSLGWFISRRLHAFDQFVGK